MLAQSDMDMDQGFFAVAAGPTYQDQKWRGRITDSESGNCHHCFCGGLCSCALSPPPPPKPGDVSPGTSSNDVMSLLFGPDPRVLPLTKPFFGGPIGQGFPSNLLPVVQGFNIRKTRHPWNAHLPVLARNNGLHHSKSNESLRVKVGGPCCFFFFFCK